MRTSGPIRSVRQREPCPAALHPVADPAARRLQPAAEELADAPRMRAQRQVLQGLFGNAFGPEVVQRDVETGQTDPLLDMMTDGSKSLLYGASGTRKFTSRRATEQNADQWGKERRTIDAYNDDIGLSKLMGAADPSNIFKVRQALAADDVVASWSGIIPPELGGYATDVDLVDWLRMMKTRAAWIGLQDMGAGGGTGKVAKARLKRFKSKHRYQKNFISKKRYKARQQKLTPAFIHGWLATTRVFADAENDKTQLPLSDTEQGELARWISKAFWRRTSKLGIDFTVGRGHRIHMNTAADTGFNFDKPKEMKLKAGGLKKMKETYGRMITTSEYRHIKKGLKAGTLDPTLINLYDELHR